MTDLLSHPSDHMRPRGAPGWRALAVLVTAVVVAHMVALQASPVQFGQGGSHDGLNAVDTAAKTFETRSIDVPAAPPAAAVTPAPPTPVAAAPVLRPKPKTEQKRPVDQQIRAQAASESIANTTTSTATLAAAPDPLPDTTPSTIPGTIPSAATTPTLAATATPSQATLTAADLATALPASGATAAVAGLQATPVTAINLPGSARLQYKVVGLSKSLKYQATAELLWKANGDKYEAMLKVSAFLVGSRSMTSVGQITATGLAPTRFSDKSKSELAAHFEPAKGKIIFSANTPDAPWAEGAQDRVSVFLQLGGILAAKPAEFPAGASVTIYTVGPREAEPWTFVVESTESQEVLGAPMDTLKLTRKPRREFDQKIEVWYAPSLGYLPVRNRITQPSGDFVDQQLNEISRS